MSGWRRSCPWLRPPSWPQLHSWLLQSKEIFVVKRFRTIRVLPAQLSPPPRSPKDLRWHQHQPLLCLKLFLKVQERLRLGVVDGISVKFFSIGFCCFGFMCSLCQLPQRCGTKLAAVHAGRRLQMRQSEIMPLLNGLIENRQNISHKIKSGFPLKLKSL